MLELSQRQTRREHELKSEKYVVSKDEKTGMWYVHLEGFAYVPVFGSFRKSKRAAQKIANDSNAML